MKLFAILFLALFATSYANQAVLKGLAQIHKDPDGAAVLSAIALNLKVKTPLEDVGDLLNDILNKHLGEYQNVEAQFQETIEDLEESIADGQTQSAQLQQLISTTQFSIDSTLQNLAQYAESLSNYQGLQAQEEQAVADREAAYNALAPELAADVQGFQDAIDAANQAISKSHDYKQSSENSASFIQLSTTAKDRLKKFTDKISGMRKKLAKYSNLYTPLTRELIDLSVNLDQSKIDQVIDLLNQLLGKLQDGLAAAQQTEADAADAYQSAQDASAEAIADYINRINGLQADIDFSNASLATDQQNLQAAQDTWNSVFALLQLEQASLQYNQAAYAQAQDRFNTLISLIRRAIGYFNTNLSDVDAYVSGVANGSDGGF